MPIKTYYCIACGEEVAYEKGVRWGLTRKYCKRCLRARDLERKRLKRLEEKKRNLKKQKAVEIECARGMENCIYNLW